jgi:hypothetical protein
MSRIRIAVLIGLTVIAAALALTLSHSPISIAQVNDTHHELLLQTAHKTAGCQTEEVLPAGISAIRLEAFATAGPRVRLSVSASGRTIVHGEVAPGWTGGAVTVPVRTLPRPTSGATLCFYFYTNGEETIYYEGSSLTRTGSIPARTISGSLPGRIRVEYLRPGHSSWWSLATRAARRMGLGRAWSGTWIAFFVALLMAGVVLLSSRLALRELR